VGANVKLFFNYQSLQPTKNKNHQKTRRNPFKIGQFRFFPLVKKIGLATKWFY